MNSLNNESPFKVLVFGMGAIGTYIGGSLAAIGHEVTFVEREELLPEFNKRELRILTPERELLVSNYELVADSKKAIIEKSFDFIILAVKSFDTPVVLDSLDGLKLQNSPILCLQNGVENEELIRQRFGEKEVIAGTITSAVSRTGIGNVKVEKLRGVGIETGFPLSSRLIREFNHAGLRAKGFASREDMKWSKMLTNLLANATCAILDWTPSQVLSNPLTYQIEVEQIKEALLVMKHYGIRLVDLPGTPVKLMISLLSNLPGKLGQNIIGLPLAKGRGSKMPSLLIDLRAGKLLSEVEFLNGAVARYGEKVGIKTPINTMLTQILVGLSSGRLEIGILLNNPKLLLQWVEGRL
jgi:2-dehydropantoate 2-reductase